MPGSLPPALRCRHTLKWAGWFLVVFLGIHWQEVTSPTFNVDDWGTLGGPIRQLEQSRPSWDLIYGVLFQDSFSPFLGWCIAAASIFGIAACLPLFQAQLMGGWIFFAALLIASHAYLLDLFNFSFVIGLYLLPGLLSIWGGVLIAYNPASPLLGRRWRDAVLGVAMIAFAMGIYQPTGVLALTLIGFDSIARAFKTATVPPRQALRLLVGVLAAALLYYSIALLGMVGHHANERTGFASPARFLHKLTDPDVYREIYATDVSLLWRPAQILLSSLFLLMLVTLTLLLWRRHRVARERRRQIGWLWFGAGWLTLSPLFLFYVLQAGFPSRSFCLGNVGIVGFLVIGMATLWTEPELWHGGRSFVRAAVGLLVVAYIFPQAVFAGKVWERTQLLERRDMAMAQSIAADVRARASLDPQIPGDSFRLFGTTKRNQSFPQWSSVGESVFHQSWSIKDIFRQLLGLQVEHISFRRKRTEAAVRRSIPACKSWPANGSIVAYRGRWLVCLEANPAEGSTPVVRR